jgi:hypothetical protein
MAKARVSINQNDLHQIGKQAAREFAKSMQPALDNLHRQLAGQPVERIKPQLAQVWRAKAGRALTEPELTTWATAISQGERIVMKTD